MTTATQTAPESRCIPYGPDHRTDLEAFIGQPFRTMAYGDGPAKTARHLAAESLCGITYDCYELLDGRVLVTRTDRYTCHTQATIWADYSAWSQWWHTDRRRGEIDPETGRPFPGHPR